MNRREVPSIGVRPKGIDNRRQVPPSSSAVGVGREDLRLALEAENIEARPVWKPMHLQPVLRRNSRAFELTPVRSRKDAEPRIFYNSSMS